MKLPFPFKSKELPEIMSSSSAAASWPWPACVATPKTVSFRSADVLKTMNSAYAAPESEVDDGEGEDQYEEEDEAVESVIRGLRSERLFFRPGETSSILEEAKVESSSLSSSEFSSPFKESLAVAVDSRDPFVDFRASMEEMVAAHRIRDWAALEELLTCYLQVNGKSNHGYIVGAFVDLLVSLATRDNIDIDHSDGGDQAPPPPCSGGSSMTHSFTSPFSFSSGTTSSSTVSPTLSLAEVDDETEKSSVSSSSNHISIVPSN